MSESAETLEQIVTHLNDLQTTVNDLQTTVNDLQTTVNGLCARMDDTDVKLTAMARQLTDVQTERETNRSKHSPARIAQV